MNSEQNIIYQDYYSEQLEISREFQDFLSIRLLQYGLLFIPFSSSKYQKTKGESWGGIEVKYDNKYQKTGNLYIEYAEKSNPENLSYIDSGILSKDNTWLWVIGDYKQIWIFGKSILQLVILHSKLCEKRETPTSRGGLLPLDIADKYCCKHIVFEDDGG